MITYLKFDLFFLPKISPLENGLLYKETIELDSASWVVSNRILGGLSMPFCSILSYSYFFLVFVNNNPLFSLLEAFCPIIVFFVSSSESLKFDQ